MRHKKTSVAIVAVQTEMNSLLPPKQVIVVRKDLKMRLGKVAAQVAHAASSFLLRDHVQNSNSVSCSLSEPEVIWVNGAFTKIVLFCQSESELLELIEKARNLGVEVHEIIDSGKTEFHNVPTLTCAAFGPDYPEKLDPITKHLPLA